VDKPRKLQRGDRVVLLATLTHWTGEEPLPGKLGTVQKANTGAVEVMLDGGTLLMTSPKHLAVVERRGVTAAEASAEKGYPHPGSVIVLPSHGGRIHLQYGHRRESHVGTNGCFTTDVITGLILNLETYQEHGHPMATSETQEALRKLHEARMWIDARKADRRFRGVYETDEA